MKVGGRTIYKKCGCVLAHEWPLFPCLYHSKVENCKNHKTIKIEDLEVGDKVKYKVDDCIWEGFINTIWDKKIELFYPVVGSNIKIIRKDQIISKLEPITEYKEIPIEKPRNFVINYGKYDVWPRSRTVSFPFPDGCDFTKKYLIEIKEL